MPEKEPSRPDHRHRTAECQADDVNEIIQRRCGEIIGAVFDGERTWEEAVPSMKEVWCLAMYLFWCRDHVDLEKDGRLWDEGPAAVFRREVARLAEIANVNEHDLL